MIIRALLPLIGVVIGWALKSISDYLTLRREDVRRYRTATFYLLRSYKALMDYERATRYFRQERPSIDEFEPWRAILEQQFLQNVETNGNTTSEAVETLASVDPPLAARMENTIKNVLVTFGKKDLTALSKSDPDTYAKLIYNQDHLVENALTDFRTVALLLASHSGLRQKRNVRRWFSERESGTKDFMKTMQEQRGLLKKVIKP